MKLNINVDYRFSDKIKKVINMSNAEYTIEILSSAVSSTYKDGLGGQLGRLHGRLIRKFDDAIIESKKVEDAGVPVEVEVDASEVDHIKKILDGGKFNPAIMQYVVLLQDEVNKL